MLKSHFDLGPKHEEEQLQEGEAGVKKRGYGEEFGEGEILGEVEADMRHYAAPEEERAPQYPERRLHRSEVSVNMSMLGKTADGDAFTYLKAEITGLSLTEISAIKSFKHLQFLDLSNNVLNLKALQAITELPFLVLIKADKNVLRSAALSKMKYLQVIIMNKNFIRSVEDIYQPELSTLELGENQITLPHFKSRMATLRCLDLRNNLIQGITELNFPHLDSLYLAGNKIKLLDGIERLVNLRLLHLRHNPIRLLTPFTEDLTKLKYLNLRNCKVYTLLQVKKLRVLPALTTLILKGCPFMGGSGDEEDRQDAEDDPDARIEVLAALPKLTRFNKAKITPEEKAEARELMMNWLEEGEKDEEEIMMEEQLAETEINED